MKTSQLNIISQLKNLENPCDILFNNIPMGIFILNREKRIIYVNLEAEKLMNCSRNQLYNHYLTQFLYPDDIPVYIEHIKYLTDKKRFSTVFDSRVLSEQGETAWWRLYAARISGLEDLPDCSLIIARDINTQKQDEKLLRTAKQVAEDANRAKTEFLANMSHEIRTPIHTIVGMTELLLETNLNKEQKEYVKQVRFSSDTLLALINHVLDFSRIEAGNVDLNLVEFNLYRMLENSVDLIIQDINKKNLEMILFIDSGVPELIKGDPIHLHQIIRNLLNNALKFTEQGEIQLSVERIKETRAQMILRFSVKDTGIGIDQDKIETIFQPFSQEDNSYSREYGGTGVGLSIVRKLIELMNGRIMVESVKGKSSHFYFDIVVEEYHEMRENPANEARIFAGLKVMIVNNNRTIARVLKRYLEEWGCRIFEVPAEEVWNAIWNNQLVELVRNYDLGLIDLKIDDIKDVLQLAGTIKSGKQQVKTKLILLRPTRLLQYKDKSNLLQLFDSDIMKPVKKRDLFSCIYKLFHTKPADVIDGVHEVKAVKKLEVSMESVFRILVVEDHEVNREFFCTILNKMGYVVERAENGQEALRLVETYDFSLIFMDIQMPGMNGYEVTAQLRDKGLRVPIIAVTANTIKGEITRCLQAGMNDFLAKPFRKSDLLPILQKWLGNGCPEVENQHKQPTGEGLVVFDFNRAVEMFLGQKDVVLRLLAPFVERLLGQIGKIRQAIEKKDFITVQHEAHAIKGGALNIQAIELGTRALELEKLARNQETAGLEVKLLEMEQAYGHFRDAVESVLAAQR